MRCQPDYEDTTWLEPGGPFHARILVTYTCDVRPSPRAQQVIRDWVERGGRMVALHGTSSSLDQTAEGWAAPRDCPAVDRHARLAVHRPPTDRARISSRTSHPTTGSSTASRPSRPPTSCTSTSTPTGRRSFPLLQTTYRGDARGFAEADWNDTDPDHLVMYLRPLGAGGVLYNTLGHCRGHYDMVPLEGLLPERRSLRVGSASVPRVAPALVALGARRDVVTRTIKGARWT